MQQHETEKEILGMAKLVDPTLFRLGFAIILVIIASCHCFAQSPNTLKVVILDQNADFVGEAKAILTKDGEAVPASVSSEKGVAFFSDLGVGSYQLTIEAPGFKLYKQTIFVKGGENSLKVILEIEEINENVSVELSAREKKFDSVITKIFTQEEIAKLPTNPKDIEKELKRKFGANVVIKVDGFSGGKIPDKSQIASVKVIRSVFDAEFHDAGSPIIEIKTRAGGREWSGSLSVSFADAAFNARDAFADEKLPMNEHNISFAVVPPSIGNNTSFYFSFSRLNNKTSREFIGLPPFEVSNQDLTKTVKSSYPVVRLTQNLSEYNTLYTEYAYYNLKERGLGLGWFDLPERAYSNDNVSHTLKLSEHGIWGEFVNEFRLEYEYLDQKISSLTKSPPIIVLEAFNKGGAGLSSRGKYQTLKLANVLSFDAGRHTIKVGGELEYEKSDLVSLVNPNGSFTFSSIEDFERQTPALYIKQEGEGRVKASNSKSALFFQDNIRISQYFQVGMGVRYEHQSGLRDYNNFAPRFGFVWSPEETGRLMLMGGFGIGYSWLERDDLLHILRNNGKNSSELIIQNPGFPNPFAGHAGSQIEPLSIIRKDKNLRSPEGYYSSLGVNYEPTAGLKLTAIYVYGREANQFHSRDINASINGERPNPKFGRVVQVESTGNTFGHLLTLNAETNLKGFPIQASYQFSRFTSDHEGIFDLPSDSYNLRADWGPAIVEDFVPHKINLHSSFNLSKVFRLKQLKNITARINFTAASGLPYTITTGRDDNNDTVINDRPLGMKRNSGREKWTNRTDVSFQWNMSNLFSTSNKNGFVKGLSFDININNLFNQTNSRGYVGVQTSPFFRQPTYSDPARNINFGLYITF